MANSAAYLPELHHSQLFLPRVRLRLNRIKPDQQLRKKGWMLFSR
jgi:hypothetical protein